MIIIHGGKLLKSRQRRDPRTSLQNLLGWRHPVGGAHATIDLWGSPQVPCEWMPRITFTPRAVIRCILRIEAVPPGVRSECRRYAPWCTRPCRRLPWMGGHAWDDGTGPLPGRANRECRVPPQRPALCETRPERPLFRPGASLHEIGVRVEHPREPPRSCTCPTGFG